MNIQRLILTKRDLQAISHRSIFFCSSFTTKYTEVQVRKESKEGLLILFENEALRRKQWTILQGLRDNLKTVFIEGIFLL